MKIYALGRWHNVSSLADASRFVLRTTESMGSTEWYNRGKGRAGLVVDRGRPIAKVSYNGRIWAVGPKGEDLRDAHGREIYRELRPSKHSPRSNPSEGLYRVQYREFNPHLGEWGGWRMATSFKYKTLAAAEERASDLRRHWVEEGGELQFRAVKDKR